MNWTEAEYAAYLAKLTTKAVPPRAKATPAGHLPDRYKSKLERAYAQHLTALQHAGAVLHWDYEPLKLRLANTCFYTPDFLVIYAANPHIIELQEVKGWWRDDARIKIKVAAEQRPYFIFKAVQHVKGSWTYEGFGHAA